MRLVVFGFGPFFSTKRKRVHSMFWGSFVVGLPTWEFGFEHGNRSFALLVEIAPLSEKETHKYVLNRFAFTFVLGGSL